MKKYSIIHNFTATAYIEVLAETREEAFEKARENQLDLYDYNFELDSAEIITEEDVPDLQGLISQAGKIIEKYMKEHDCYMPLETNYTITTEVWDGVQFVKHNNIVDNLHIDTTGGIIINSSESIEIALEELSDIEQFNICKLIIQKTK